MPNLARVRERTEAQNVTTTWSASTTCTTCGDYTPCNCPVNLRPMGLKPTTEGQEGDLCKTLVFFSTWQPCARCGMDYLTVDWQGRDLERLTCDRCLRLAKANATPPTLPSSPLPKSSIHHRIRAFLSSLIVVVTLHGCADAPTTISTVNQAPAVDASPSEVGLSAIADKLAATPDAAPMTPDTARPVDAQIIYATVTHTVTVTATSTSTTPDASPDTKPARIGCGTPMWLTGIRFPNTVNNNGYATLEFTGNDCVLAPCFADVNACTFAGYPCTSDMDATTAFQNRCVSWGQLYRCYPAPALGTPCACAVLVPAFAGSSYVPSFPNPNVNCQQDGGAK